MRSQVETDEDREARAERQRRFGLLIEAETEEISKIMASGGKLFKVTNMRMCEIDDASHIYTRDKNTGNLAKSEMRTRRVVLVPEHLAANLNHSIARINSAADYYDELVKEEYPNKIAKRPKVSEDPIAREIRYLFYKAHAGSMTTIEELRSAIIDKENTIVMMHNSGLDKGQNPIKFDITCRRDLRSLDDFEANHPGIKDVYSRRHSGNGFRLRIIDHKSKTRHFSVFHTLFVVSKSDATIREAESRIPPDSRLPDDRVYLSSLRVTMYEKQNKKEGAETF